MLKCINGSLENVCKVTLGAINDCSDHRYDRLKYMNDVLIDIKICE